MIAFIVILLILSLYISIQFYTLILLKGNYQRLSMISFIVMAYLFYGAYELLMQQAQIWFIYLIPSVPIATFYQLLILYFALLEKEDEKLNKKE